MLTPPLRRSPRIPWMEVVGIRRPGYDDASSCSIGRDTSRVHHTTSRIAKSRNGRNIRPYSLTLTHEPDGLLPDKYPGTVLTGSDFALLSSIGWRRVLRHDGERSDHDGRDEEDDRRGGRRPPARGRGSRLPRESLTWVRQQLMEAEVSEFGSDVRGYFDDMEWIAAPYGTDGRTVSSLVHTAERASATRATSSTARWSSSRPATPARGGSPQHLHRPRPLVDREADRSRAASPRPRVRRRQRPVAIAHRPAQHLSRLRDGRRDRLPLLHPRRGGLRPRL